MGVIKTNHKSRKTDVLLIFFGLLLAAGIFFLDLSLPLGVAGGVPYVAVVLIGMWFSDKRYLYTAAIVCTGLMILGYGFSPGGGETWKVAVNRLLALFVIWVTTVLCLWKKAHEEKLEIVSRFANENPNPVLRFAGDGEILYANNQSSVLLNHWNCEVGQAAPSDWRDQILEALSSRSRRNTLVEIGGQIFSFEVVPISSAGYVNAYGRDITNFKKAQKALQDSETRFRTVVDSTVDAIVSIDERGTVQLFNPAAENIFGFSWSELVGQNISTLIPEPYNNEHDGYIQNYLNTGQAKIIGIGREVTAQRKDGSTFPIDLAISEMIIDEKRFFLGIMRDITQRKLGEQQREALLDDLERTNNELKDFAYIVSHDLKAPLRGISSLADWIVEDYADVLDDDGRKQLKLLTQNTRRMHHLIEGILAYSRLGREKPVPVPVDCEDTVTQVIESLAKPDTIKIRVEEDMPTVIYHKIHLQQIFQNLIGNAIKYLGKPSGEIIVSSVDCGKFQEFCVRDNGVGIEQRHFARIFKIFQALQPSKIEESTGIGLALVKKIVESHGGEVRVESTIGQGSAFFFSIPKTLKARGNQYER